MQLPKHLFFLKGVSGTTIKPGLEPGEYAIGDASGVKIHVDVSNIKSCKMICRFPGDPQVWKVKCATPVNNCSDCDRKAGIKIRLRRNPTFDHETYMDTWNSRIFLYPFTPYTGVVTATQVAAFLVEQINYADAHNEKLPVTAIVDPSDASCILITSEHPDIEFDVYNAQDATPNEITEVHEGQSSVLDESAVARMFPLQTGFATIPGAGPDSSYLGCKNPCFITLNGCEPALCGEDRWGGPAANAVHMYSVPASFVLELIVDADEPGYADFLAALEGFIGMACVNRTPLTYDLTVDAAAFTVTATDPTTLTIAFAAPVTAIDEYPANILVTAVAGPHAGVAETWVFNGVDAYTNPATVFVATDELSFEWEPKVTTTEAVQVDTVLTIIL